MRHGRPLRTVPVSAVLVVAALGSTAAIHPSPPIADAYALPQALAPSAQPASGSTGQATEVKHYIVGDAPDGQREYLFAIAAKTLGDGNRAGEIFELNQDRVQPDGGVLVDPAVLHPGWILLLPADASGPDVRVGMVPSVTATALAGTALGPAQGAGSGPEFNGFGRLVWGLVMVAVALIAIRLLVRGERLSLLRAAVVGRHGRRLGRQFADSRAFPSVGRRVRAVAITPAAADVPVDASHHGGRTGVEVGASHHDHRGSDTLGPIRSHASRFIDGPRLEPAPRSPERHGLDWLPRQPHVNAEEFDAFVWCPTDPAEAASAGIPSPNILLLGYLDGAAVAARTGKGYLLCLRVQPGGAVDVAASEVQPPTRLRPLLSDPDVYVVPAGWLGRCRLVSAAQITGEGNLVPHSRFADTEVLLLCRGARHRVPGLPEEVHWCSSSRAGWSARWLVLAESDATGLGTWQQVHIRRPSPMPGHRLLKVRVEASQLIDVRATGAALSGLAAVRTCVPKMLTDAVDCILPAAFYPRVTIENEYRAEGGSWMRMSVSSGRRLDRWRPAP